MSDSFYNSYYDSNNLNLNNESKIQYDSSNYVDKNECPVFNDKDYVEHQILSSSNFLRSVLIKINSTIK